MPDTLPPIPAPVANAVTEWLRPFPLAMPGAIAHEANDAARTARTDPGTPVVVNLAPGNGYAYLIVLIQIPELAEHRGNLLCALPDHHVSLLLTDNGATYHVPSYVTEKTRLADQDAAVIASFLTLYSHLSDPT